MRRAVFTILIFASLQAPSPVCAQSEPAAPFDVGSKFSRTVQKVTGINMITEYVASKAASAAIKKKTGGKVKVKVKTYSLTSLISGKVKALDVKVIDSNIKGMGAHDLSVTSDSPFWYNHKKPRVAKSGQKAGGQTLNRGMQVPVVMTVKAQVSAKEIERALNSPTVTSNLRGLKLDLPGLAGEELAVLDPRVNMDGQTITLAAVLNVKGAPVENGVPIKISAVPKLEGDSKILLTELKVDSEGIVEPDKFAAFAETLLNPIIDFGRLDRKDHAFRLKSFKLEQGQISGDGKLLLVPKGGPVVSK